MYIREPGVGETDSEELIGTQGAITLSTMNDIVETVGRRMPEHPVKTRTGMGSHRTVTLLVGRITERLREVFHDAQGVVPQCLDFNRLTVSRRHHPIAYSGIHPRQWHPWLAGGKQAVLIHPDTIARAAYVPVDDIGEYVVKIRPYKGIVPGGVPERPNGFEEPQGRVNRVVLRPLTDSKEAVREHTLLYDTRQGEEEAFGNVYTTSDQGKPGQGDHRVSSPVTQPVIASDHGLLGAACHHVVVGSRHQRADKLVIA